MVYDIETVHLHRVKSLYMPSDTHAKQKNTNRGEHWEFQRKSKQLIDGKNAKCSQQIPNWCNSLPPEYELRVCFWCARLSETEFTCICKQCRRWRFFSFVGETSVFSTFIHDCFRSDSVVKWASDSNDLVMMISNCRQIVWNNNDSFYEIVHDYLYKKKFLIELTKFF